MHVEAEVITLEISEEIVMAIVEIVVANTTVCKADFHQIAVPILDAIPVGAKGAASAVMEIRADLTDVDACALDAHPVASETTVVEVSVVEHLELAALVDRHLPPLVVATVACLIGDEPGDLVEGPVLGWAVEAVCLSEFIPLPEIVADACRNVEPVPALAVLAGAGELVVGFAVVAIFSASYESVQVDTVLAEFLQILVLQPEGCITAEGFSLDHVALVVDQQFTERGANSGASLWWVFLTLDVNLQPCEKISNEGSLLFMLVSLRAHHILVAP